MSEETILYASGEGIATITLNRPQVSNAQSAQLLQDLDAAYRRAEAADDVRVIILNANGKHFSAGHDMSESEIVRFETEVRRGRPGIGPQYDWERKNYLDLTHRWRDIPKPVIAAVHGKCIAGGLMLVWPCDIVMASEDAEFSDPVVRMGIGGVEYHAHTWEMGARKAKEMLFTGRYISAHEAEKAGMVNHVVPREDLMGRTRELAARIARMDAFGLRMAKASVNKTLDMMGQWNAISTLFEMHHLAHAQSAVLNAGNSVGGLDVKAMKQAGGG